MKHTRFQVGFETSSSFPPLPVNANRWFDSHKLILDLMSLGLDYAGEIKPNRKVIGENGEVWKTLKVFFQGKERRRTEKKWY